MGTLRIVAGRLRGRRLRVAHDAALRPTSDRVREALFNILGQDLSGTDVLDLYAGTGALGFEAISRGARTAVFVEASPRIAIALRQSAKDLGVEHEARVIVGRVDDVLTRERLGGSFDVVFADPPYEDHAYAALVARIDAGGILSPGGTMVTEREAKTRPDLAPGPLALVRTERYGRTALDFFKYR